MSRASSGTVPENGMFAAEEERFKAFALSFFPGAGTLPYIVDSKISHTFDVCRITDRIAAREPAFASPEARKTAWFCALYHDISRFEQYRGYRTLRDTDSFDHGDRSAGIIRNGEFAAPMLSGEEKAVVCEAIRVHNKKTIPPDLPSAAAPFAKLVRDADKLSILKVVADHFASLAAGKETAVTFGLPDPPSFTREIALDAVAGRMIDYSALKCVNDFKISIFVWPYDLNFPASARHALENGLFERFARFLPDDPLMKKLYENCDAALKRLSGGV